QNGRTLAGSNWPLTAAWKAFVVKSPCPLNASFVRPCASVSSVRFQVKLVQLKYACIRSTTEPATTKLVQARSPRSCTEDPASFNQLLVGLVHGGSCVEPSTR